MCLYLSKWREINGEGLDSSLIILYFLNIFVSLSLQIEEMERNINGENFNSRSRAE